MPIHSNKTIGLRLLRYVFGCYFVVAVIVTSIQLLSEYLHTKKNTFQELSSLADTLEANLALSIWNYDIEQLESTLFGINKITGIVGTMVTDNNEEILVSNLDIPLSKKDLSFIRQEEHVGKGVINALSYKSNSQEHTLFEYKLAINYIDKEQNVSEHIGYFYLYSSQAFIINQVKYGFILIIVNSFIKTIALWFIFLFFAERIIAKPLRLLTEASNNLDPTNVERFQKKGKLEQLAYRNHDDEIHVLANSFLNMRDSVIEKVNIIEMQNITLEQRVKERTRTIEDVNKELKHLSLHDPLTGLPNRILFKDRLEQLLFRAKREGFEFAVASVDLRKFKEINDSFGHQAGDTVLKELANRMKDVISGTDTIARMGGDEFALILQRMDKSSIYKVGEKILACSYQPIIFEYNSILAGINIGFAIYPEHGSTADILYKKADMAMYQAKKNENGLAVFTSEVKEELQRRDVISRELSRKPPEDQFKLHYQPIICGITHQIKGIEALIRWNHPELGNIAPDEFITIAERSNVIKTLTSWVSKQALSDLKVLQNMGYPYSISINISSRLVNDPTFSNNFAAIINHSHIDPEYITLEITESSTMSNPVQAMDTLHELKLLGVNLSIDDFGVGYSSFSYLTQLPVDELKIDRSFLGNINETNRLVIEAIIALAHRLDLSVVAEGVENIEALRLVEEFQCDGIQGYYFACPLPIDKLIEWIEHYNNERKE